MIRAHQHAAGAIGSQAEEEALGYSQGGFSTKIHLRCEDRGKPVTFLLTVGQRHEAVMFEPLMEQGAVKQTGPGRPRLRPERVAGDKGYTGQPNREYLRRRGIGAVIPRRAPSIPIAVRANLVVPSGEWGTVASPIAVRKASPATTFGP